MKKIFCLSTLLILILETCCSQVNLEKSNIQKHVNMDVFLSRDSILYGDTLNVTILFKNISDLPVNIFSDAVICMERFSEGTISSELFFLSNFTTNFRIKEKLQPQKSITMEYKVAVVSPFFYKGKLNIRFSYLAKPSETIIDIMEHYQLLEIL